MTKHKRDTDYRPCDTRYRTSKHFLDDQLQCSEAVADFRLLKEICTRFSIPLTLSPVLIPVKVRRQP